MKLNLGYMAKMLLNDKSSGKSNYKNSYGKRYTDKKNVNDYSKQNYARLCELEKQVHRQSRTIMNILDTLKLEKVGDLVMDKKDAKKYRGQW